MSGTKQLKSTFSRYCRSLSQKADYKDCSFRYGSDSSEKYIPGLNGVSNYDMLYAQVKSRVFKAVSIRSEDAARTTFRLCNEAVEGKTPVIEKIFSHPIILIRLLSSPTRPVCRPMPLACRPSEKGRYNYFHNGFYTVYKKEPERLTKD